MPADIQLTVGIDEASTRAAAAQASRIFSTGMRNLQGINARTFTEPLGRITGKASEFTKSLEASNARVIAFGASAGAIFAVQRAFQTLVSSTIDVEKSINSIGTILGSSSSSLKAFSNDLFAVASLTGASFKNASEAAQEFARQGLSAAETILRTRDALILARISGMDFANSAKAITTAINAFGKEMLTSTEIVNRLSAADTSFAVSSKDLADALSRVGSSAEDSNVSFNQTIALVTSAAQITGRSGSVIGNAFKSMFTRLERPKVLEDLESVGVATQDAQGNILPLVSVLKNLASTYDTLAPGQKSFITETVGGIYQINTLKAVLSDLGSGFSVYDSALRTVNNSTDSAINRNKQLNETISAKLQSTLNNLIQTASKVGELTISPMMGKGLDISSNFLEGITKGVDSEGVGGQLGRGLIKGIGAVLSGPGIQFITFGFLKLFQNLTIFAAKAFGEFTGVASKSKELELTQVQVLQHLVRQPVILDQIRLGTMSVAQASAQVFRNIRLENSALEAMLGTATLLAKTGIAGGLSVQGTKYKVKAAGYIPNFNAGFVEEESQAKALGASNPRAKYGKGKIGGQSFIMNDKETEIPNFGSNGDSAVIPNYAKGFVASGSVKSLVNFEGGRELGKYYDLRNPTDRYSLKEKITRHPLGESNEKYSQRAANYINASLLSKTDLRGGYFRGEKLNRYLDPAFRTISSQENVNHLKGAMAEIDTYLALKSKGLSPSKLGKNFGMDFVVGKNGQYSLFETKIKRDRLKDEEVMTKALKFGGKLHNYRNGVEDTVDLQRLELFQNPEHKLSKGYVPNFADSPIQKSMHLPLSEAFGGKKLPENFRSEYEIHSLSALKNKLVKNYGATILGEGLTKDLRPGGKGLSFEGFDSFVRAMIGDKVYNYLISSKTDSDFNLRQGKIEGQMSKGLAQPEFAGWENPIGTLVHSNLPIVRSGPFAKHLRATALAGGFLPNFSSAYLRKGVTPEGSGFASLGNKDTMASSARMMASFNGVDITAENTPKFIRRLIKNHPEIYRDLVNKGFFRYNKAGGHIPNFSALKDATDREMGAGYSSSQIRVGQDSSLVSGMNPAGVGVYNSTEGSLSNGIGLAKKAGFDPKTKGMARGFIPNFEGELSGVGPSMMMGALQFMQTITMMQGSVGKLGTAFSKYAATQATLTEESKKALAVKKAEVSAKEAAFGQEIFRRKDVNDKIVSRQEGLVEIFKNTGKQIEHAKAHGEVSSSFAHSSKERRDIRRTTEREVSDLELKKQQIRNKLQELESSKLAIAPSRIPQASMSLRDKAQGMWSAGVGNMEGFASAGTRAQRRALASGTESEKQLAQEQIQGAQSRRSRISMGLAFGAPVAGGMIGEVVGKTDAGAGKAIEEAGVAFGMAGQIMNLVPGHLGHVLAGAAALYGGMNALDKAMNGFSDNLKKANNVKLGKIEKIETSSNALSQAMNTYENILNDSSSSTADTLKAKKRYDKAMTEFATSGVSSKDLTKVYSAGSAKERQSALLEINEKQNLEKQKLSLQNSASDLAESRDKNRRTGYRSEGAGTGALVGAAIGTFIAPGVGTAIGFAAGAAMGGVIGQSISRGAGTSIFDEKNSKEGGGSALLGQLTQGAIASGDTKAYIAEMTQKLRLQNLETKTLVENVKATEQLIKAQEAFAVLVDKEVGGKRTAQQSMERYLQTLKNVQENLKNFSGIASLRMMSGTADRTRSGSRANMADSEIRAMMALSPMRGGKLSKSGSVMSADETAVTGISNSFQKWSAESKSSFAGIEASFTEGITSLLKENLTGGADVGNTGVQGKATSSKEFSAVANEMKLAVERVEKTGGFKSGEGAVESIKDELFKSSRRAALSGDTGAAARLSAAGTSLSAGKVQELLQQRAVQMQEMTVEQLKKGVAQNQESKEILNKMLLQRSLSMGGGVGSFTQDFGAGYRRSLRQNVAEMSSRIPEVSGRGSLEFLRKAKNDIGIGAGNPMFEAAKARAVAGVEASIKKVQSVYGVSDVAGAHQAAMNQVEEAIGGISSEELLKEGNMLGQKTNELLSQINGKSTTTGALSTGTAMSAVNNNLNQTYAAGQVAAMSNAVSELKVIGGTITNVAQAIENIKTEIKVRVERLESSVEGQALKNISDLLQKIQESLQPKVETSTVKAPFLTIPSVQSLQTQKTIRNTGTETGPHGEPMA